MASAASCFAARRFAIYPHLHKPIRLALSGMLRCLPRLHCRLASRRRPRLMRGHCCTALSNKSLKGRCCAGVGVSGNAYAVRNTATSAGGQGAESTGPSILNEAGLGSRRRGAPQSEGRYSDQAWRCAYADGCTSLRRMKNQRRSGDAPKSRHTRPCMGGQYRPRSWTDRYEK